MGEAGCFGGKRLVSLSLRRVHAWVTSAPLSPQEAESRPRCRRLQLKDMIPTEMQRLTKYPLLLQSIGQNTGTRPSCLRLAARPRASRVGVHLSSCPPCPQRSLRSGRR